MQKEVIHVAVTGAAGQICYNLLFRIAAGALVGKEQKVALHLLEVPAALNALKGVVMELQDSAFPLLTEIKVGSDPHAVFEGVDIAILVGAKPRSKGMERKDLLLENAKIFVEQGRALNRKGVQVLVVGNPCNTNALVLKHNAPDLPVENIRAMMRLDQNRAIAQIAEKLHRSVTDVKRMTIWGNHSSTMVPDYINARIGDRPALELLNKEWFQEEMIPAVQKRGAAIIEARGFSSAASAAHAALVSVRDWREETPSNDWYSAAIYSNGNPYGIADDLFFSFPLRNNKIVADLKRDAFLEEKIKLTEKELLEEREGVREFLCPRKSSLK